MLLDVAARPRAGGAALAPPRAGLSRARVAGGNPPRNSATPSRCLRLSLSLSRSLSFPSRAAPVGAGVHGGTRARAGRERPAVPETPAGARRPNPPPRVSHPMSFEPLRSEAQPSSGSILSRDGRSWSTGAPAAAPQQKLSNLPRNTAKVVGEPDRSKSRSPAGAGAGAGAGAARTPSVASSRSGGARTFTAFSPHTVGARPAAPRPPAPLAVGGLRCGNGGRDVGAIRGGLHAARGAGRAST